MFFGFWQRTSTSSGISSGTRGDSSSSLRFRSTTASLRISADATCGHASPSRRRDPAHAAQRHRLVDGRADAHETLLPHVHWQPASRWIKKHAERDKWRWLSGLRALKGFDIGTFEKVFGLFATTYVGFLMSLDEQGKPR